MIRPKTLSQKSICDIHQLLISKLTIFLFELSTRVYLTINVGVVLVKFIKILQRPKITMHPKIVSATQNYRKKPVHILKIISFDISLQITVSFTMTVN